MIAPSSYPAIHGSRAYSDPDVFDSIRYIYRDAGVENEELARFWRRTALLPGSAVLAAHMAP